MKTVLIGFINDLSLLLNVWNCLICGSKSSLLIEREHGDRVKQWAGFRSLPGPRPPVWKAPGKKALSHDADTHRPRTSTLRCALCKPSGVFLFHLFILKQGFTSADEWSEQEGSAHFNVSLIFGKLPLITNLRFKKKHFKFFFFLIFFYIQWKLLLDFFSSPLVLLNFPVKVLIHIFWDLL